MTNHTMKLLLPQFTVRWYFEGEECTDSQDGDIFLIDHGTFFDTVIKDMQDVLALSEPELDGYTWCAHVAIRNGKMSGLDALSEMGPRGHERRTVSGYKHHVYAVVSFSVERDDRMTACEFDDACSGLDYGWLEYPPFAFDDLTGAKFACTWGDTIICSTHVTMCAMGLGLFPDRPPAMVAPARMALWFKASVQSQSVPTTILITPGIPQANER
jgi:hypothetical protein